MRKPGKKTSEFAVTVATLAVSAFLVVFGAVKDRADLMAMGMGGFAFGGGTYAISRGVAKKNQPEE